MPAAADETPSFPLTEYNILDLCMPPYQLLTATIDTLNVIAFGILALAFSLLVVIIELFGEIRPELRTPGSYLLAIAVSLAAVAFLMGDVAGFRGWSNKFDGRRFLIGYTQLGRTAVLETIQAVIAGTSAIGKVRDRKRLFLLVALLFCIGAAVCIAIGRAEAENPASPLLLSSWRRGRYLKPEIGAKMPAMEKGSSAPEQAATKSKTQPDDTQLSEGLRALGRKYAEETGFEPLKPGERLKPLWYLTNMSGKSLVGINERIKPR